MGTANTTIRAVYTQTHFRLRFSHPQSTTFGTATAEKDRLEPGESTIITALPADGFEFVRWQISTTQSQSRIENSTAASTTFTLGIMDTYVEVYLRRITTGEVLVLYLNMAGDEIEERTRLIGNIGDQYRAEPKDIKGYLLVNKPDNEVGQFTLESQTVSYVYNKEQVNPKDPLYPEIEVDPENKPDLSENQGPLSIDFVSGFRFGEQVISVQEHTYYANPQRQRLLDENNATDEIQLRPNYVQISDRRLTDERGGWELSVTQRTQFVSTNGHELTGAFLTFKNQELASVSEAKEPTIMNEGMLELHPGQKQSLLQANRDTGVGTWIYRFGDKETAESSVGLTVPGITTPRTEGYQAELLWELSAVPSN
ncbi:MucBP domain protein [Enterococcus faecalis 06-MB-DW-09]|nr:MucBP domain protein [Enterococcus faecalis 06-MB-DW-09]